MPGGPQDFRHEVESDGTGRTVLRLRGELDMATGATLTKLLHELQHDGDQEIVVDLRGLSFLDSMGLSALMEAHGAGQDGDRTLSFIAGAPTVHRVFQVARMDDRVTWSSRPFSPLAYG
jgi:anti-sigma B factor antagonist